MKSLHCSEEIVRQVIRAYLRGVLLLLVVLFADCICIRENVFPALPNAFVADYFFGVNFITLFNVAEDSVTVTYPLVAPLGIVAVK